MDFEKNNLHLNNDYDNYKTDEINKIQQGNESFRISHESFSSKEEYDESKEINDFSSNTKNKPLKQERRNSKQTSNASSAASSGSASISVGAASIALPSVVIGLVGAVAVIGVSSGLIQIPPSNHVSLFMSRSTELGFEIDRDPNKSYVMYLTNEEYSYSEAVDFIDQVVFKDLIPNTVYDLAVYETSVDPNELVYAGNYLTPAYDQYSSSITNATIEGDRLTFDVNYEGNNIDFVTIIVYGDNNQVVYKYEGSPIDAVTVNAAGYESVTCSIAINGQMTHFEQLFTSQEIIHVTSVSLDQSSLELSVGDTYEFVATVLPENATNKEVIWSSSNSSVVSVDNGVINALNEGKATITVKSKDGYKSSSAEITVVKKPSVVHVTSVSLNETTLNMETGDRYTLLATVLPSNASDKSVNWSSNNDSVATVDSKGKITAVSAGQVIITATTTDGGLTASCTVSITQKIVPVTGIKLNYSELELSVGGSESLVATVLPTNATNKEVIWSSTNEAVVTVDENGLVSAVGTGDAIIVVKTVDGGYQGFCTITVI
ncbi:MAG: Ig-like domain-containing protein [Bacilli bacterium]|nr:Ig-like domain-containing protein [Bacilli bacterium]